MTAAAAPAHWELFPHQADVGVRGFGPTVESAFEQAALALTAAITDPAAVLPEVGVDVAATAPDRELLLAAWLNALIFEMSTRHMLFGRFSVRIDDLSLTARAWGEAIETARHQPATEPKGATLTALAVASEDGGWRAQCVVDV